MDHPPDERAPDELATMGGIVPDPAFSDRQSSQNLGSQDQAAIAPLLSAALAPLFARPTRLKVESAWYGHLPFAHWIVAAARPRMLVELGAHAGVSYSAFCEAVLHERLDTRCFAVDTWEGDEHAGFYGESIHADLKQFHDARYGGFSEMLRCTFDDALAYIPDASIDLLHIDGRHHYVDVRHDFDSWRPKLSSRAVVMFHDTNVRERGFGVWQLWTELLAEAPGFEFWHGHGLGVLALGADVPAAVRDLCTLTDPESLAALRERFALLGERWIRDFELHRMTEAAAESAQAAARSAAWAGELQPLVDRMHGQLAELIPRSHALRVDLAAARLDRVASERRAASEAEVARRAIEASQQASEAARQAEETARQATAASELARARTKAAEIRVALADQLRRQAESDREAATAARHDSELRVESAEIRLRHADDRLREAIAWALAEQERANAAEHRHADLSQEREAMRRTISWRLTRPLRYVRRLAARDQVVSPLIETIPVAVIPEPALAKPEPAALADLATSPEIPDPTDLSANEPLPAELLRPDPEIVEPSEVAPTPEPASSTPRRPKVLFASGESHTPGNYYRCERMAALARENGWDAAWLPLGEVGVPPLVGVDLVVLWRAEYSDHVKGIVEYVREHGGTVAFDIDDLVFRPEMATREMLDSVRIGTFSENGALALFRRFRATLDLCDMSMCSTDEIAVHLRRMQKTTWVVPNGFDDAFERAARLARRAVRMTGEETLVRIGYAAGSRTHQKDFAEAATAVAAVLRARLQTRLTLFRDPDGGEGVLLLHEFPEFVPLAGQIEWRDMVKLPALPGELARYDINIAPLETGNPFCEAKSELKYFEAALADVPTVATPSGPLARAIRDGETGFLASDPAQWEAALLRLVDDPQLRRRVGRDAYHDVLWQFGPRRRAEMLGGFLAQMRGGPEAAAAFELEIRRGAYRARGVPLVAEHEILFQSDQLREAEVTVTIASYNYSAYVLEALDSVRMQTLDPLDLVVVDDVSPDDSVDAILQWVRTHAHRFNRVTVLRHKVNAGLGASRNSGFNAAETPFVLPLDSDNRLHPQCCEILLEAIQRSRAAYAYPQLQNFGASEKVMGGDRFEPRRFVGGNYIDAMALVAKWAWAAGGGYYQDRAALGWEDYDLWCSLAELGQWGEPVAQPLAEYRVHPGSMVNAITETAHTKRRVVETVEQRHAWLSISARDPYRR